jgi:hypothetical protein
MPRILTIYPEDHFSENLIILIAFLMLVASLKVQENPL